MREYPYNTIFYDRRFLKVGEYYIPIVQIGDDYTLEYNNRGNKILHKKWEVLGFNTYKKILFKEEELKSWFSYPDFKGNHYSKQHKFHDNFSKWLLGGIERAMTIEEAAQYGNYLEIKAQFGKGTLSYKISTTAEFYYLLSEAEAVTYLGYYNREFIVGKNLNPGFDLTKGYYVLEDTTMPGYYLYDPTHIIDEMDKVKKFKSESSAKNYLHKYISSTKSHYEIVFMPGTK